MRTNVHGSGVNAFCQIWGLYQKAQKETGGVVKVLVKRLGFASLFYITMNDECI